MKKDFAKTTVELVVLAPDGAPCVFPMDPIEAYALGLCHGRGVASVDVQLGMRLTNRTASEENADDETACARREM